MHYGHKHESFIGSVELSVMPSWKVRGLLRNCLSKGKLVACTVRCKLGRQGKSHDLNYKTVQAWTASVWLPGE